MNFMDKVFRGPEFDLSKPVKLGLVSQQIIEYISKSYCSGIETDCAVIQGANKVDKRKIIADEVYNIHNNVSIIETPDEYIIAMLLSNSGYFRALDNEPHCAMVCYSNEIPHRDLSTSISLYEYRTKLSPIGYYKTTYSHIVPDKVVQLDDDVYFARSEFGRYYIQIEN